MYNINHYHILFVNYLFIYNNLVHFYYDGKKCTIVNYHAATNRIEQGLKKYYLKEIPT